MAPVMTMEGQLAHAIPGWIFLALLAAMTISCGPKALELPAESIERAATCGVVTAAGARKAAGIAQLPIGDQMRIMHFAMLAGAGDKGFDRQRTALVIERMRAIEGRIGKGKWEELAAPCAAAFPETAADREIKLPENRLDAQLACYSLADFVERGLDSQGVYGNQLSRYASLRRKLDRPIGSGLAARGASGATEMRSERDSALSSATRLGSPVKVMDLCFERFESRQ